MLEHTLKAFLITILHTFTEYLPIYQVQGSKFSGYVTQQKH